MILSFKEYIIEKKLSKSYGKGLAKSTQDRLSQKGWSHEPSKEEVSEKKSETWEDGYKRRVVKTTKASHIESGFKWRIKGKERPEISIKLYKTKPDFEEFKKQMKRVAGHEFGG